MTTIGVKDAAGATQNIEVPLVPGQKTSALSRPVVIANDQSAVPISGTVTVNGVSTTAADRGAGAATAQTLRTTIDTGQLGALIASGVPVISGGYDWIFVPASSTAGVTLPSTITGSYIEHLMCVVTVPATSKVQIKDGSGTARDILPDNVAGGIGTYVLPIGITSKLGAWQVITPGAGVSVIATFHV